MTEEQFPTDDYVPMPINKLGEERFRRQKDLFQFERLKVGYHEEGSVYTEFADKKINFEDAQYVIGKLTRHFKLPNIYARYKYQHRVRVGGTANKFANRIVFRGDDYKVTWHILAHEVNHFLCWKVERAKEIDSIRHGTKKWNRQLQRILKYIKAKEFWEQEMKDRDQRQSERWKKSREQTEKYREEQKIKLALQSLEKTKPTKEDKKKQKIVMIEKKIKGYQRKIKLNQTLLKKANKKLKRLFN